MAKSGAAHRAVGRRHSIGAVDHAIALLRCLSQAGAPLRVSDIANRIGIHKSSVSRLAATLERTRIIERDPTNARLSLGIGLVALAAPVFAALEVLEVARSLLVGLASETRETVSFNIWDGTEAVSIERVPGSNSVRTFSSPGYRNPGHATASGKALLAYMGDATITAYCTRPLARFTEKTITEPATLVAELERCRTDGYALNIGELEADIGAVASIVFDRRQTIIGSVAVSVPMYRFGPERRPELVTAVRRCAAEISMKLGYSPDWTRI
jgi:DNA-binding IclR family transcriptional regulator